MGYDTKFIGELKTVEPLTDDQADALDDLISTRGDVEFEGLNLYNFDFVVTDDGIAWSQDEKSYDMVEKVNYLTTKMREQWPEFAFTGYLEAYGETAGDVWVLFMQDDGRAVQKSARLVPVEDDE